MQATVARILPDLAQQQQMDMAAEIAKLRAENERLKQAKPGRRVSFKVTEKGGVSAYGMGRFPVTLYRDQWLRLLDQGDELRAFLEANAGSLSVKE